MMGRGRKMLRALRRGRTSARADSPARTRFARVRRATQRGLLVTAHGELRPVALIILSPATFCPFLSASCSAFSARCRPRSPATRAHAMRNVLGVVRAATVAGPCDQRSACTSSVQRGSPVVHQQDPSTAPSLSSPTTRPATCAVPGERSSLSPLSPTPAAQSHRDARHCFRGARPWSPSRSAWTLLRPTRRSPHTASTQANPLPSSIIALRTLSTAALSPSRRDSAAVPACRAHLAARRRPRRRTDKGAPASISRTSRPPFRRPSPRHKAIVRHIGKSTSFPMVSVGHTQLGHDALLWSWNTLREVDGVGSMR